MNYKEENFNEAISVLSAALKNKLIKLNSVVKSDTYEIRLRIGKPVILCGRYGNLILKKDGCTSSVYEDDCYICKPEIIVDTFNRLCCFSVYSHIESIINGYITYQGGHRAGIAGTAVVNQKGEITSVNDISGINIRVAREVVGAADEIISELYCKGPASVIIAGPPSSGKTTVLRDIIRQLSNRFYKISVIDERQEIASVNGSICQNDVGINTDVFNCYPKGKGIMNALKTMSPQIIALDEVGEEREIEGIVQGMNSGVDFITTVHAASYCDLLKRPQLETLLSRCSFDYIVLLKSAESPGETEGIYDAKEIYDEIFRSRFALGNIYAHRDEDIIIA